MTVRPLQKKLMCHGYFGIFTSIIYTHETGREGFWAKKLLRYEFKIEYENWKLGSDVHPAELFGTQLPKKNLKPKK
jgi:hypothetical protein